MSFPRVSHRKEHPKIRSLVSSWTLFHGLLYELGSDSDLVFDLTTGPELDELRKALPSIEVGLKGIQNQSVRSNKIDICNFPRWQAPNQQEEESSSTEGSSARP